MRVESPEAELVVTRAVSDMPDPAEVESLYAAASAGPPLEEPPQVATMFARLYRHARGMPGALVVSARRRGELVGLAYGHDWTWQTATDDWSRQLRDRLGERASELEDSLAVQLLAVAPSAARQGLGRRLLDALLVRDEHAVAWLQTTDIDSPARRLYDSAGWAPLGHGPDAPNGAPGLVMVRHAG